MGANVRGRWLMAKAVGTYWIKDGIKGKALLMSPTRGRRLLRLHRLLQSRLALKRTSFARQFYLRRL
jgi:hypothetical protein